MKRFTMYVTMTDGVAEKFRRLLADEGDDAVVRIREAKIGSG